MIKNYKNKKLKKAAKIYAKMPKNEKSRVNVKEKVEDNVCDLSLTGLYEIPVRGIAAYKRVTILDLSSNNITSLGRNFSSMLSRLVRLNLSRNQLRTLPDDFGQLRNLRHLDMYDNKLEYLPMSFGDLINLRYLDLKGNPLAPAFVKAVGPNMTTKDCQDSARNTVIFMATMQAESKRTRKEAYIRGISEFVYNAKEGSQKISWQTEEQQQTTDSASNTDLEGPYDKVHAILLPKPNKNKKNKNKKRVFQIHPQQEQFGKEKTDDAFVVSTDATKNFISNLSGTSTPLTAIVQAPARKITRSRKPNGWCVYLKRRFLKRYFSSTVLRSILTFFFLLAINILVIYMIMFKNPELADKIVEAIPQQHRDWIMAKTEIFRVNIGDWIADFLTPPDEQ